MMTAKFTLDWLHCYRTEKREEQTRTALRQRRIVPPDRILVGLCHGLGFTIAIDQDGHTEVSLSAPPGYIVTDTAAGEFFDRCNMEIVTYMGPTPSRNARIWKVKPREEPDGG